MMTHRKTPNNARKLALGITAFNIVILLVGLVLALPYSVQMTAEDWVLAAVSTVGVMVYGVSAVLILSRHPRHAVGWLFLFVAFSSALLGLGGALTEISEAAPIDSEAVRLFFAATAWAWVPPIFVPLTLVLQFFPDGHLPSRRWWPVTVAAILSIGSLAAPDMFGPADAEEIARLGGDNPLAIPGSDAFFAVLEPLASVIFPVAVLGSLAAVVVRFYRSEGVQRQQMKWLVYTAVLGISLIFLLVSLSPSGSPLLNYVVISFPIFQAAAIGIAIVRHRLFDIDVIIRRTLQYAILTGLLALVYFGLVVLFQGLFSEFGEQSGLFTVISTLAVAALFSPLRRRVQQFIDRRFYRRKYDAEQALARFAATTRDEVDMEELTTALLGVVEETIQPEHVSLWLAPGSGRRGERTAAS